MRCKGTDVGTSWAKSVNGQVVLTEFSEVLVSEECYRVPLEKSTLIRRVNLDDTTIDHVLESLDPCE